MLHALLALAESWWQHNHGILLDGELREQVAVAHCVRQRNKPVLVQVELLQIHASTELWADLVQKIVVELQILQCRQKPHARWQRF